jgi:hypothetical protein
VVVGFQLVLVQKVRKLLDEGAHLVLLEAPQHAAVQVPHHLVGLTFFGARVLLEFHQQVVQEGALAGTRRPLEDVDLVLARPALHGGHVVHEAVGEEAIREERAVGFAHEELPGIVRDEVDRLRVLRIFVVAFVHVTLHHVVEKLEDVAHHPFRLLRGETHILLERHVRRLLVLDDGAAQLLYDCL